MLSCWKCFNKSLHTTLDWHASLWSSWSTADYRNSSNKQKYVPSVYYFAASEVFHKYINEDSSVLWQNTASLGKWFLTCRNIYCHLQGSSGPRRMPLRMKAICYFKMLGIVLWHCYIPNTRILSVTVSMMQFMNMFEASLSETFFLLQFACYLWLNVGYSERKITSLTQ